MELYFSKQGGEEIDLEVVETRRFPCMRYLLQGVLDLT
jgi:hypothetical protein